VPTFWSFFNTPFAAETVSVVSFCVVNASATADGGFGPQSTTVSGSELLPVLLGLACMSVMRG